MDHETLYQLADAAGQCAAKKCVPTPMIVQTHANPADGNSPVIEQWHVPGGVCGYAEIVVRPGTCSFARWLMKNGHGHKHYYSGVSVWAHTDHIPGIGGTPLVQSLGIQEAFARAFAGVLCSQGIKGHVTSRMN